MLLEGPAFLPDCVFMETENLMLSLGAFPWDNAAGLQQTGSAAGASLKRGRWSDPALAIQETGLGEPRVPFSQLC